MSSVGRQFSQIDVRVRYFIGLGAGSFTEGSVVSDESSAIILNSDAAYPGATGLAADLDDIFDDTGLQPLSGKLYKDMGRSITVIDSDGKHVSLYRNVQLVNGSGSEGVGGSSPSYQANIYLLVWSAANPDHVAVARVG
jgi:hypothetical protein